MNKSKEENAITLVAVVVTIIVLLVVAGVTIDLLLNNNSLIETAQKSSNIFSNSSKEENQILDDASEAIENQTINEKLLVSQFKKGIIKTGDYINYTTPETGEFISTAHNDENSNGFDNQVFNTENNGTPINWRVLGLGDENGNLTEKQNEGSHLLLISDDPVQKVIDKESEAEYKQTPYLFMGKAEAYVNGERILNKICDIYKNSAYAESARSINATDINTVLGIKIENDLIYEKNDESRTNLDILRVRGQILHYSENDYSAESYLKNKTALQNGETSVEGTGYSYFTSNYNNISIGDTTINDLLFKQTDYSSQNSKAYWLATKGTEVNNRAGFGLADVSYGCVNVGGSKFKSNGSWLVEGFGVRPIIILKSNLTDETLQITTKKESNWNFTNNLNYSGNLNNY